MVSEQELQQLFHRVATLEERVNRLYKSLGVADAPETSPVDDPRVFELIRKGDKIGAIKRYRELTNAGLAEAKSAVEDVQHRLGPA